MFRPGCHFVWDCVFSTKVCCLNLCLACSKLFMSEMRKEIDGEWRFWDGDGIATISERATRAFGGRQNVTFLPWIAQPTAGNLSASVRYSSNVSGSDVVFCPMWICSHVRPEVWLWETKCTAGTTEVRLWETICTVGTRGTAGTRGARRDPGARQEPGQAWKNENSKNNSK